MSTRIAFLVSLLSQGFHLACTVPDGRDPESAPSPGPAVEEVLVVPPQEAMATSVRAGSGDQPLQPDGDQLADRPPEGELTVPIAVPLGDDVSPLDATPLVVAGDVVPPVRLSGELPQFLGEYRAAGMIIVQAVIDTKGRVRQITFLRDPSERLRQPFIDALLTWRFKPAELHGEPVSVYYNLTINIHPR